MPAAKLLVKSYANCAKKTQHTDTIKMSQTKDMKTVPHFYNEHKKGIQT